MPFRGQLDPNMTPTWPCLGPPEGQSDLYFTWLFEDFMFRFFIVLRGLKSPPRVQHRPHMGPKRIPKSAQMGGSDWGRHSLFRLRCWKAFEDRFGSDLGPLLGGSGAEVGPLWGPLGPRWGSVGLPLGPSWAYLGGKWAQDDPKGAPNRSKMATSWPHRRPGWAPKGP